MRELQDYNNPLKLIVHLLLHHSVLCMAKVTSAQVLHQQEGWKGEVGGVTHRVLYSGSTMRARRPHQTAQGASAWAVGGCRQAPCYTQSRFQSAFFASSLHGHETMLCSRKSTQPCAMFTASQVPDIKTFFVTQNREKCTDSVEGAAAQESTDSVINFVHASPLPPNPLLLCTPMVLYTWWLLGLAVKRPWLGPGGASLTLIAWTSLENTTLTLLGVG